MNDNFACCWTQRCYARLEDFLISLHMLDWLARLVTHIPGRYEQTVRYYGWYSNKSRGMRKKAGTDDIIPAVMPNDLSSKESRQNWARLIQKIYEVDPLVCPKCQGPMKIIAFIEELDIIEKILRHLDLWDVRNHDPPQKVSDESFIYSSNANPFLLKSFSHFFTAMESYSFPAFSVISFSAVSMPRAGR